VRGTDVRAAERQLDRLVVGDPSAVDAALLGRLVRGVERLWPRGWQPVDLPRMAARRLGARPARMVLDLLAAQRRTQAAVVPPWFDEQLRDLDARVWWDDDHRYLAGWVTREGLDRVTALREAVDVLALIESLPPIAVLRPPPGTAGAVTAPTPGGSGSRMLDRVRALLAKAESTTFPAEAEALTAKAQELMTGTASTRRCSPRARGIGRPGGPAQHRRPVRGRQGATVRGGGGHRCESVWSDDLGFATVLGYPTDRRR
jgi:hypothetical protein